VFAPPAEPAAGPAAKSMDQKLIGTLRRKLALAAGKDATVTFVVVWHFPNDRIDGLQGAGTRRYAKRFKDAAEVAEYVAKNCEPFTAQTRLWHDTWYDSTLPYWFLDRTFLNISILATSTAHWFASDRFWGWEGVGCCHGTCTHVWHYAHAVARLFPSIERDTRERVDLGLSLNPDSGVSGFRGEFDRGLAVDGQSGTILRIYREHQMSPDDAFLKRNWPKIKTMFKPLLQLDGNDDGVLEGAQMNTLDQAWFGKISWLSSLYIAALRAGEAMAREMGETEFAERCRTIVERGSKNIDEQLFNGEYYLQLPDKNHAKTVGSFDGCEIDQVFGQSWVWQVGLPRVLPEAHVKTALQSLWRCNFSPDVGPWRKANKPGRWYAMAGEAGLIMCTWPKGDAARVQQGYDFYFNECMNGFEYQAAGHMIWEGLLQEGLAVTRAVHDRYHAARRNPWNEVECGDHYARSMASHGVFLAACGYEYHGPKGHLGFAPRLTPDDFRAPFTAAEGWGTFSQKREGQAQRETIELKSGKLRVKTLAFALPEKAQPKAVSVTLNGQAVQAAHAVEGNRITITLAADATIQAGQKLEIAIA
ncbi:MAG: GH116 family glycosyl hydrolase, partial [Planctomycetota bacterium]|nr:GH116 family glycosyl hydrolase [Planctomycetota bacterium]